MNILFVSALMPYPLYSGGQVRVYNLIRRLAKKHDITLVTFLRSPDEKRWEKDLSFCRKIITFYRGHAWQPGYVLRAIFGTKPLLLASYDHEDLREEIATELATGEYDLVHIEPWYVWPSIPITTTPVVAVTHNIEYGIYAQYARTFPFAPVRPFYYWDVVKLRFWEEQVWKRASKVVAVSVDDAHVIQKAIDADSRVAIIPNGVDVSSFRFAVKKTGPAPVFLFVGSFAWMQNRDAVSWLVQSIWPRIQSRYPQAILRIVGRSMPSSLRFRVAGEGITVFEHVEEIENEFHDADILLAPIRIGGGTSFKILEAMACGLPVVTTTLGATGLSVTNGQELMIGDTPDQLFDAADTLLSSPQKRQEIAKRARIIIEKHYTWDRIASSLDALWHETAKRKT